MIQLFHHYVPGRLLLLAALEAVALVISVQLGLYLHFAIPGSELSTVGSNVPIQAGAFALGMMIILSSMGLYHTDLWSDSRAVRLRLVSAFVVGFLALAAASYLLPSQYHDPVSLVATIMILAIGGSFLIRAAFYNLDHRDVNVFKRRVLVLGTGSRVSRLAENAQRNPNHRVVGYVALQPATHYVPSAQVLPLAQDESLLSVAEKHAVDEIVVAVRDRRGGGFPVQQLLECKMKGLRIVELPTFFEREYRQVMLESLNPSWMVLGDGFRKGLLRHIAKRVFDLTVAVALLVLSLPILLFAALCIFLESGLPVLYRQERVGQGGRVFTLYKLRSMKVDAESDGSVRWAAANDDRTTWVGRIIRKCRIDELPQLFNVLNGTMSFVGPRPERPFFVDQLVRQVPYYDLRHTAKPGITGWAQVRYAYGASVDDAVEKLQHDLYYVKNQSLFLDITILLATVEVVLWGKGAR